MLSTGRHHQGPPTAGPVTFDVDGDEYTLPTLPTRTWLHALVLEPPGNWLTIVPPQLAGDGRHRLNERLADPGDVFDLDDLEHVAENVIADAVGIDFHPACRLAVSAWGNWLTFDGWCSASGFDPLAAPIGRLLAAVYAWRLSLCQKKEDLTKLDAEVWAPPPPLTASGRPRDAVPAGWSDEVEANAFEAAMAALGTKKRP